MVNRSKARRPRPTGHVLKTRTGAARKQLRKEKRAEKGRRREQHSRRLGAASKSVAQAKSGEAPGVQEASSGAPLVGKTASSVPPAAVPKKPDRETASVKKEESMKRTPSKYEAEAAADAAELKDLEKKLGIDSSPSGHSSFWKEMRKDGLDYFLKGFGLYGDEEQLSEDDFPLDHNHDDYDDDRDDFNDDHEHDDDHHSNEMDLEEDEMDENENDYNEIEEEDDDDDDEEDEDYVYENENDEDKDGYEMMLGSEEEEDETSDEDARNLRAETKSNTQKNSASNDGARLKEKFLKDRVDQFLQNPIRGVLTIEDLLRLQQNPKLHNKVMKFMETIRDFDAYASDSEDAEDPDFNLDDYIMDSNDDQVDDEEEDDDDEIEDYDDDEDDDEEEEEEEDDDDDDDEKEIEVNLKKRVQVIEPQEEGKKEEVKEFDVNTFPHKDLLRGMRGLINRVAEASVGTVSDTIVSEYFASGRYPRGDVTDALTYLVAQAVGDSFSGGSVLVLYATLMAHVHRQVGAEVGGQFLDTVARRLQQARQSSSSQAVQYAIVLCYLAYWHVVHTHVLFGLCADLVRSMSESDVEILVAVIQHAGPQMRSDSPAQLRDLILAVQSRSAAMVPVPPRVDFMLQQIYELKNNKRRAATYDSLEELAKRLRAASRDSKKKKKPEAASEQLRIDWDKLVEGKHGRWWLVGSAHAANDIARMRASDASSSLHGSGASANPRSLSKVEQKVAARLRLTSPYQKAVLSAVLESEDVSDAQARMTGLPEYRARLRDSVDVVVRLAMAEPTYNGFYGQLLRSLASSHRKMPHAVLLILRDRVEQVDDASARSMNDAACAVLAKLTAELVAHGVLTFGVLRGFPMDQVILERAQHPRLMLFLAVFFSALLQPSVDDAQLRRAFAKLAASASLVSLRNALKVFFPTLVAWFQAQRDLAGAENLAPRQAEYHSLASRASSLLKNELSQSPSNKSLDSDSEDSFE